MLRSQHFLVGRLFRCRCCYKLRDRGLVANELGRLRLFGFFDFDEGFRKVLSFASEFLICFVNIDLSGTPTEQFFIVQDVLELSLVLIICRFERVWDFREN